MPLWAAFVLAASASANAVVLYLYLCLRSNPKQFFSSAVRGAGLRDLAILVTSDSHVLLSRDWGYGEDFSIVHAAEPLDPSGFLHRSNHHPRYIPRIPRDHGSDDSAT